jgi:hypothetical protein
METLLLFILIVLVWIFIMLSLICLTLYKLTQLVYHPRTIYNKYARKAVTMRRKDVDAPIIKYAASKVAVFFAIRYIGKKMR